MEMYLGTVMPFPYQYTPLGWLPCNGQTVSIAQNTALFSLLGTIYGGDGRVTFGLPALNAGIGQNGRIAAGQGTGSGLTPRVMGDMVGSSSVGLTVDQMPAHNHGLALYLSGTTPSATPVAGASVMAPVGNGYLAPPTATTNLAPATVMPAGQNALHNNQQPTLDLVFCICTEGQYPQFS
jgi:microcystin-dependent protein